MDPADFPSARLAFDNYVQPSYSLMLSRHESAHSRLQQLGAVVPSVVLAGTAFIAQAAPDADYASAWLILSLSLAALSTFIAWGARFYWADFFMVEPGKLYADELRQPPEEFQVWAIGWAATAFDRNRQSVLRLFQAALASTALFGVAVGLLTAWAIEQI